MSGHFGQNLLQILWTDEEAALIAAANVRGRAGWS